MKNKFRKYIVIGTIAIVGTMGYNFSINQEEANIQLIAGNIEALASEESGDSGCSISVLTKYDGKIVLNNAKNKWFGVAAGCKKKCDHTCTVKDSPDINIEF